MKAQDLRIGNYILRYSRAARKYYPVQMTADMFFSFRPEDYKPIEITPGILEGCGFKQSNGFDGTFRFKEFDLYKNADCWEWIVDDRGDNEGTKPRVIRYMHQLQNLYYALTGQELTVNLETLKLEDKI